MLFFTKFFNIILEVIFSVSWKVCTRKYYFLLTNTFETNIGVKQGYMLTPTLFSLYINDLIDHFGPDCEPLELNNKPISCLLYADDIILLSESAKGLQKSLDILKTYCDKWNLKINIGKTKVIVFNKSGRILKGFSFLYDDEPISLTNEYKYLGILFKPSGTFSDVIDYLSKKACKAMFCIRKNLYSNKVIYLYT